MIHEHGGPGHKPHASQAPHARVPFVAAKGSRARLLLDGREVGNIVVGGGNTGSMYGTFTPCELFADFAPLFGRWSLLMHEDEDAPLHRSTAAALADAERQLDALHVEVHYLDPDVRQPVQEVSIDGGVVEWREF